MMNRREFMETSAALAWPLIYPPAFKDLTRSFQEKKEDIPPIKRGDILGKVAQADETTWVIFKKDKRLIYINEAAALLYFDNGAIIPHWLTPDLTMGFAVTDEGRLLKGGPLENDISTYGTIRHLDNGAGIFIGPPAVDSLGEYVAVIKKIGSTYEIDVAEKRPHHGGTIFKAPNGWIIAEIAFGVDNHQDDLLLSMVNSEEAGLYWLVNGVTHKFPPEVIDAAGPERHPENDEEMKYILQKGWQRDPGQEMRLEYIPNSRNMTNAVIASRDYPEMPQFFLHLLSSI